MKRRRVNWTWENPDAQKSFAEWVGFDNPQTSAHQVDRIETLLSMAPPARVLDVGCGTGRHSLEMARRGYDVTGIDVADGYLQQAEQEAYGLGLSVEFRLQRGADLREELAYDYALAYNHTLGFMSDEQISQHLGRIRTALKPSGSLLLVLAGPALTPDQSSEKKRDWAEKNGKFILSEKYMDGGYRRELGIVIDTNAGEITEFTEGQRAFSLDDVTSLLMESGFGETVCLRDLDGDSATPEKFGVFVCRR